MDVVRRLRLLSRSQTTKRVSILVLMDVVRRQYTDPKHPKSACKVSILVLMDVVRRLVRKYSQINEYPSLNPCFNGCSTPTSFFMSTVKSAIVSILVLMDVVRRRQLSKTVKFTTV